MNKEDKRLFITANNNDWNYVMKLLLTNETPINKSSIKRVSSVTDVFIIVFFILKNQTKTIYIE